MTESVKVYYAVFRRLNAVKKKIAFVLSAIILAVFLPSLYVFADTMGYYAEPHSIVIDGGDKIFFLTPEKASMWEGGLVDQPPTGLYFNTEPPVLIYSLDASQSNEFLFFASRFFFSEDGRFLVQVPPFAPVATRTPDGAFLDLEAIDRADFDFDAIWFYENGALINSHLLGDLGIRRRDLMISISGANWLDWSNPPTLDVLNNTITLTVVYGDIISFDISTGDILFNTENNQPTADILFSTENNQPTAINIAVIVLTAAAIVVVVLVVMKRKKASQSGK